MKIKLDEGTLANLRACNIPSLQFLNYMSINNLRGDQNSPLRYFAQSLADRLESEEFDERELCISALEVLNDFMADVALIRKSAGRESNPLQDTPMIGGLYGYLRNISRDICPPEFAEGIRTVLCDVQKNYLAQRRV